MFDGLQDDEDAAGDAEMSFKEFLEAMVAIGLFKCPHPLYPPEQRMKQFITTVLLQRVRVRYPKLNL
jgi:hypothetical protein